MSPRPLSTKLHLSPRVLMSFTALLVGLLLLALTAPLSLL